VSTPQAAIFAEGEHHYAIEYRLRGHEDPAAIRAAILEGAPEAEEIGDRRAAIGKAVAELKAGDVLLIAGKGHETGQTIGDVVHPFSDQDEVRAAFAVDLEPVAGDAA